MNMFTAVLVLACTPTALLDFAMPKWEADKSARIEDAYKWIHQATRGGEHAAPDRGSAMRWLNSEWDNLEKEPRGGIIWESLCPDGSIGRVNLRQFRAAGGDRDSLLNAFLASAAAYKSDPKHFIETWSVFGDRLKRKGIGHITHVNWQKLNGETRPKNYPAIHHSPAYEQANNPAYRIVLSAEARKLIVLQALNN